MARTEDLVMRTTIGPQQQTASVGARLAEGDRIDIGRDHPGEPHMRAHQGRGGNAELPTRRHHQEETHPC